MALFGRVRAEDLLKRGERASGRLVGIAVRADPDGGRTDTYAVEVLATPIFVAGLRQRLRLDVVRLGMGVTVRHLDGKASLDWPGGGPPTDWAALDDPPAAGIVDDTLGLAEARRGLGVTVTLDRVSVVDGPPGAARVLQLDLTVQSPGRPSYPARFAAYGVPHYATHLCHEGRSLPAWVDPDRLDRVVIDWPAAAMADPGVRRPPAAVLSELAVPVGSELRAAATGDGLPIGPAVSSEHTPVAGVGFEQWVAVEAGLIRDRVPPGEYDRYAQQYGVAAGVWEGAVATWRGRIMADWRLSAAFGEAIAAALAAGPQAGSSGATFVFGSGTASSVVASNPGGLAPAAVAPDGAHAAVLAGLAPLTAFLQRSGTRPRRRRSLVLGLWLTLLGVVGLVVGGFVLAGNQAAQVLAAADRAQVPDPLRFEAEDARYTVILLPSPLGVGVPGDAVAGLACDVVRADGSTVRIRGSRQGLSVETGVGATVGSFDAVAGPTTVTCDFVVGSNSSGYFVSVAEQRPGVTAIGLVGMVGGGLVLALGIVLTVLGARSRATRP